MPPLLFGLILAAAADQPPSPESEIRVLRAVVRSLDRDLLAARDEAAKARAALLAAQIAQTSADAAADAQAVGALVGIAAVLGVALAVYRMTSRADAPAAPLPPPPPELGSRTARALVAAVAYAKANLDDVNAAFAAEDGSVLIGGGYGRPLTPGTMHEAEAYATSILARFG